MRLPLSDARAVRWWQAALAACVLGAFATPLGYIAIGAPANFAPAFSLIALPLVLASIGWAFYLALRQPRPLQRSVLIPVALAAAAAIIAGFVFIVSNFTLLQPRERLGILAMVFLVTTVCALPLVLWRRGALLASVVRLPATTSAALLALILIVAGAAAALHMARAPAFI